MKNGMLLENQLGTGFRVLLTRTNKGLLQNPGFQLLHLKQGFRISLKSLQCFRHVWKRIKGTVPVC